MKILVLNSGSSSIKFLLFAAAADATGAEQLLDGELSGTTTERAKITVRRTGQSEEEQVVQAGESPEQMFAVVLGAVQKAELGEITAVGHRVVHPGAEIQDHLRITARVLAQLEVAAKFAPLHDPEAIAIIREAMRVMPTVPHFACFDTVFHQTMPQEASIYAIPKALRDQGVRRFGFHGLSCESILRQMETSCALPSRMVIAHLGSGCSVTALRDGRSIDTTMGLTPAGGVVMGTRPGDLDPGVLLYLLRQKSTDESLSNLERMLNQEAGMVALTDIANNMELVRQAAAQDEPNAVLGLKVFTRSIRKAIGGFAWLLGGLDAIVFSGGIGEHDAATRSEILNGTDALIDPALNAAKTQGMRRISGAGARTTVFVVPAQEDLVIALHVKRMVESTA